MQIMINTRNRFDGCDVPYPSMYLMSPWTHPADGWAIATRAYARAFHLAQRGAIQLYDTVRPHAAIEGDVAKEMAWMKPHDVLDLAVWSGMLTGAATMIPKLRQLQQADVPVGLYLVFERQSLEPELVDWLSRFPIWVQSLTNRRVLVEHGLSDVTYIPYPWFANELVRFKGARGAQTRFYWIGRFEPRKSPGRLLLAFLEAFEPSENVHLTLKCSPLGYSFNAGLSPDRAILEGLRRFPKWSLDDIVQKIEVIEDYLTADQMLELHKRSSVYVSPSRGEGLELGAWHAKLCGNRIITTENGGANHYLDSTVDILVPATGLVPADPRYDWGAGATYIDYDQKDLVKALREMHDYQMPGRNVVWRDWQDHAGEKVGRKLVEWAEGVAK